MEFQNIPGEEERGKRGKTMESGLVPRVFFVGEVSNIDGDTGGYNLQAAFSTGAMAATGLSATNVSLGNGRKIC